jgi:hypothetical protein
MTTPNTTTTNGDGEIVSIVELIEQRNDLLRVAKSIIDTWDTTAREMATASGGFVLEDVPLIAAARAAVRRCEGQ